MSHSHAADEDQHEHQQDPDLDRDDSEQAELGALEQALAEAREDVLRTRADMDNLRKRLGREMDMAKRYAGERIFAELLPVLDSLEQGLTVISDEGPARQGLELTCKQLTAVLEKQSVLPIDPAGQAFDPGEHQAVSMQATDAHPENTVLVVLQKGYRLHDRVLRPAMVVVSTAPTDA